MKLAIVGSRDFDDYYKLCSFADYLITSPRMTTVISGGARGADSLAKRFASDEIIEYLEFLPDWDKLGKKAGFVRNHKIVDTCDIVLAFWDGKSKGTAHTIELAKKAKKPTFIVYF